MIEAQLTLILNIMNLETPNQYLKDPGFSWMGAPNPKVGVLTYYLANNSMKIKEFEPQGGKCVTLTPPPYPPMPVDKNLILMNTSTTRKASSW